MADFGHPMPFVTFDVDQWSLRFETGMAMAFSTRKGQANDMKSQTRKWEVAIKTMYIPWGSLALPKPQAFLGTKFPASSCQGRRLALYPARVMNNRSSVAGLRIPSTL